MARRAARHRSLLFIVTGNAGASAQRNPPFINECSGHSALIGATRFADALGALCTFAWAPE
jgi:hypothetical protein